MRMLSYYPTFYIALFVRLINSVNFSGSVFAFSKIPILLTTKLAKFSFGFSVLLFFFILELNIKDLIVWIGPQGNPHQPKSADLVFALLCISSRQLEQATFRDFS